MAITRQAPLELSRDFQRGDGAKLKDRAICRHDSAVCESLWRDSYEARQIWLDGSHRL